MSSTVLTKWLCPRMKLISSGFSILTVASCMARFSGSGGLRFHFFGIFTRPGGAVAFRAVIKNLLRSGYVGGLALPRLHHRVLQSPSVRKTHFPRVRSHGVHGVQVLGRRLGGLAAGKKSDSRHRCGYYPAKATDRALGHFCDTRLLRAIFAGQDHVGFEYHAFERNAMASKLREYRLQGSLRRLLAAFNRMIAVNQ